MRKHFIGAAVVMIVAAAAQLPARAEVGVDFVDPQHYTDVGEPRYLAGAGSLGVLRKQIEGFAARCLRDGERVDIRILDVDLAGQDEWWHRAGYGPRVMREITWPRIELEYTWRDAAGRVLGEARERVADMNYLRRSAYVRGDAAALGYERHMLRDWFDSRFCRYRG